MLHIVESDKPVSSLVCQIEEVVALHGMGVLGFHDLRRKMIEKDVAFERECVIVEVCNPEKAARVLSEDMMLSTVLPCRISLYEEQGKTKIATLRPTAMMEMFGRDELAPVALEVEKHLFAIMAALA
jgi:uncharacterized protein (DUF302 family)